MGKISVLARPATVEPGAFDAPTGTHLEKHIFVADKGDYYEIKDGLPQNAQ